jgi:hypothetical protein
MLRYHMAVLTTDKALRREVKRVTTATGAHADFLTDASEINPKQPLDLAIFDARAGSPDKLFFAKTPESCRIIYIIPGDSLVDRIPLLTDARVISLLCHDERFDDDEFIATATKGLRGEVFGLQKYFPWGVTTFSMLVKSYEEKGRAIDVLNRYAHLAGVRGPVRDRIQLVADELMMNALYHAPVDEQGLEIYRGRSLKELARLDEVSPIQVQYGCSGRYFGIAVRDGGGSLTRARALEYLTKARTGAAIENKATGAGLGLVSVLRSVSKLVFNLERTSSTEVIGLFDMDLFAKGKVGARSLHLFAQAPTAEAGGALDDNAATRPARRAVASGQAGKWALAAILLAVVSAMGTAYVLRQIEPAGAARTAAVPHLTITAEPADAIATLAGKPVALGRAVPWPEGQRRMTVRVAKPGHQAWTRELTRADVRGDLEIFVSLLPVRPAP